MVDRKNETLEAALKAYNARLEKDYRPSHLKDYPDPKREKERLKQAQTLVRETQTMLEDSPPPLLFVLWKSLQT